MSTLEEEGSKETKFAFISKTSMAINFYYLEKNGKFSIKEKEGKK